MILLLLLQELQENYKNKKLIFFYLDFTDVLLNYITQSCIDCKKWAYIWDYFFPFPEPPSFLHILSTKRVIDVFSGILRFPWFLEAFPSTCQFLCFSATDEQLTSLITYFADKLQKNPLDETLMQPEYSTFTRFKLISNNLFLS